MQQNLPASARIWSGVNCGEDAKLEPIIVRWLEREHTLKEAIPMNINPIKAPTSNRIQKVAQTKRKCSG